MNEMFFHNLKLDSEIKGVYNEEGTYFTLAELEEYVKNPVLKKTMIGPYYFTDPTEEN